MTAVGDQQLERGVVEVDIDLYVAGRDLWGAHAHRSHTRPLFHHQRDATGEYRTGS
jgi:hypothetical protein